MAGKPIEVALRRRRSEILTSVSSFADKLAGRIRLRSVVLTGSWSSQEALLDSDIDLLIISDDFQGVSTLDRLASVSALWPGGYAMEVFPHTIAEILDGMTQGTLHILDALNHGQPVYDDGSFKQLQELFRGALKSGAISLTKHGWKYDPVALKEAPGRLSILKGENVRSDPR